MFDTSQQEFRQALAAHEHAVALHLLDPNVTLIDLGLRIKEAQGRLMTRELAVRVHLKHKPRGEAFRAFASAQPARVITERSVGFPVDLIQAEYNLHRSWWWPRPRALRAQMHNPLRGGISISNEWEYGFGTLGGFVKDRQTGAPMILSNWHVLAVADGAEVEAAILQPGYGDGGNARHVVAHLRRDAMRRGLDAAVAELNQSRAIRNEQLEIGPVTGVGGPELGMRVHKSGRASGHTHGIVDGIAGKHKIYYHGFPRIVDHVIHIAPLTVGGEVSAPGDSGSWWLEEYSDKVVGLHLAGSNDPEYGLAHGMQEVLDALNVDIVTH